jgi:hypothetical protein
MSRTGWRRTVDGESSCTGLGRRSQRPGLQRSGGEDSARLHPARHAPIPATPARHCLPHSNSHADPFTARSLRLHHVPSHSRCEAHACGTDALGASVARRPGRRALTCLNRQVAGAPTAMHERIHTAIIEPARRHGLAVCRSLQTRPSRISRSHRRALERSSARRRGDRVEGLPLASLTGTSDRKLEVCCGSRERWLPERS